jgi:hypothetical protein
MKFEIAIQEVPTIERWVINEEYDFEIELLELKSLLNDVINKDGIADYDINNPGLTKFLIDNEILKYEKGEYLWNDNFDDYCNALDKIIYNL